MAKTQIFDRADFEKLNQAEKGLADVLSILDDAESCGVDCALIRDNIAELQRRLGAIRERFMSPAPKR